jgi:hypothetical protein
MRYLVIAGLILAQAACRQPSNTGDDDDDDVDAGIDAPPGVGCTATSPRGVAPETYVAPTGLQNRIEALIDGAQDSIDLQIYLFTVTDIADRLIAAKQRGVAVRVLFDPEHAGNGTVRSMLTSAGVTHRNMPTLYTAIVYPGTVLFEGTMLSEGRGTTRPFELVGAPWIDAEPFADAMNALELPGAFFRPAVFEPTFQKHAKQACGGCQIHVTSRDAFRPVRTGAALIATFRRLNPAKFAWRQPPYEYEKEKLPFDILAGSDRLRVQIERGMTATDIAASWHDDEAAFRKLREKYFLY